jgi:ABC-type uncharacterized transport system involved in gliding motility auxiliary subunit
MKISKRTHRLYRLQQAVFVLLLIAGIALFAQLSVRYNSVFDLTANGRNTLSASSKEVLHKLGASINVQVFISPDHQYRPAIVDLLQRYQAESTKLNVSFTDPARAPEMVRKMNIQQQGEIVISRGERVEHVHDLSEQSLTNALIRVSKSSKPKLVFIEGHGERSPSGQANFDLSTWRQQLELKGFSVATVNLAKTAKLPDDTAVLVIASSASSWLPGEKSLVNDFVKAGGHLLWLTDPASKPSLASLAGQLNIEFVPGMVIDPNASLLGIDDPRFALVTSYANDPVGQAVKNVTVFPKAQAIDTLDTQTDWHQVSLLNSQDNSWSETNSKQTESIATTQFDKSEDIAGPLSLGYVMTRGPDGQRDKQQRVAVIGDGDFVSNSYIGNGGNLDLGIALMSWLSADDDFIAIPVKTTIDSQLDLSSTQSSIIGLGFLFVLPLLLLAIGLGLWWWRRKQ